MQTKERERVPHLEEGNQEFLDAHVLEAALASALERCTARHSDDDCTSMYLVSRTDQLAINGRIVRGWGLLDERLAIVGALLEELALAARGTADRVNGRRNEARHRVYFEVSRGWRMRRRGSETRRASGSKMERRPNVFRPSEPDLGRAIAGFRRLDRSSRSPLLSRGPRQPARHMIYLSALIYSTVLYWQMTFRMTQQVAGAARRCDGRR